MPVALGRLQSALGSALRARVAGEDAADRAARIWDSPGERWFTDEDPVWRVHADAAMFPGGVAALLLQMLHPMAMAGVAGHSGYKGDPWGRLQRTSTYLAATTFGTVEHALETIGHVRSIHERVRGKDAFGRPYRASDPHLLRWVHVAEAWSFLGAYQTFAQRPLTPAEADTYVAQAGVSAAHLGVLDPPRSARALEEELRAYRPELEATTQAREAARFLLVEPPLPVVSRPGYWAIAAGGVALLPDWARAELGLPASPTLSRGVLRPLGRASTSTVRWAMAGAGRDPERAA
ncbi:oxygenase MpaB family protein [Serinicoccus hydrothermalis]|uniref:oxygenase MpaB family protein n=1 Tax=Serinicoccus hydrothermalis TaxID=1758689 RepID=UPI00168AF10C|nr:oxygenase MpaB family protein [Serinicoccus hydrothermalis]